MSIEHEYIRSELTGRFNDMRQRVDNLQEHLKHAKVKSAEVLIQLEMKLSPQLALVANQVDGVKLQLQEFDSADEADWGRLREVTESEWNRLTEILDKAEHELQHAEDVAKLPPYLKPRDSTERNYSVSGRM